MIALHRAARDLEIEQPVGDAVAAQQLAHYQLQRRASHRRGDADLADGALEPVKMLLLVADVSAAHREHFIDRVPELQPAILDMHPRLAMRQ